MGEPILLCLCLSRQSCTVPAPPQSLKVGGGEPHVRGGRGSYAPVMCSWHPFCSTCATYLPGKCSWSGQVSTTKFTKSKGGRGSHASATFLVRISLCSGS